MSAEKSLVNYWLNSKGYFTINNLNASGNKNIGIIGLKFSGDKLEEAIHAEISCSVTHFSNEDENLKKILKRFSDKGIIKAIGSNAGKNISDYRLRKMLVVGKFSENTSSVSKELSEKGIELFRLEDMLLETMLSLDTAYYKDEFLRTLQLVKYLLLAEPSNLASLLSEKSGILNVNTRGHFLNELLKQEIIKKEFSKADEMQIIGLLRNTSLMKPDRLAEALEKEILNKRGMNRLLSRLVKSESKEPEMKIPEKNLKEYLD